MKILIVSNLYPPNYIGGYEIGCSDFVNYVKKQKKYELKVLTSNYGIKKNNKKIIGDHNLVHRQLITDWSYSYNNRITVYLKNIYRELQNRFIFKKIINNFKPDIVFFWSLTGISLSLTNICKNKKIPFSIYVFDEQYARLDEDFFYRQIRKIHQKYFPHLNNMIFASKFLKKSFDKLKLNFKNKKIKESVISWGVRSQPLRKSKIKEKINILYVGQIVEHKGLHLLLSAIDILGNNIKKKIQVNIYGGIINKDYFLKNLNFVKKKNLQNIVSFKKKFNRSEMKGIMKNNDILVFPSIWDEPFGITLLEAQSFGLAILASDTGGTKESLLDGIAGMLFKKNDIKDLTEKIKRLVLNKKLIEKYSKASQNNIKNNHLFSITLLSK